MAETFTFHNLLMPSVKYSNYRLKENFMYDFSAKEKYQVTLPPGADKASGGTFRDSS